MLNLLHDTVRNVEGGKNFIVHVSKDDFEYINDRKDQLTEGLGSTDTIEVIEDLTLRQSECFVEAEGGIYDCGIGTELELLKKELMLLAYQKS
jgi:flagellar assembly protein FliH